MEVILRRNKETKNTVRFQGESEDTAHLNIYLLKSEVQTLGNPERIKVTIRSSIERR